MTTLEQLQAKYDELVQHYQIVCEELDELRRRYEPVPYTLPRCDKGKSANENNTSSGI